MIFVRSQALDNTSADQCVLDGLVLDAADPAAAEAMALLSDTMRHGHSSLGGVGEIINGPSGVVVKVNTGHHDNAGRAAPLMVVLDRGCLRDIDGAVRAIELFATRIGREVDAALLAADLVGWERSGKANGGRLRRAHRRILSGLRRSWLAVRRLFGTASQVTRATEAARPHDESPTET